MERAAIHAQHGGGPAGGVNQAGQGRIVGHGWSDFPETRPRRTVQHQRDGEFVREPRGQRTVMRQRPLFGRPSGERRGQHEFTVREVAFRTAGRQRENRRTGAIAAGGRGQIEIAVDHVDRRTGDAAPVEEGGGAFAHLAGVKPVDSAGARRHGHQCRLQQPLKIDGHPVAAFDERPAGGQQAAQRIAAQQQDAVDERVLLEQRRPFGLHDPGERRIAMAELERPHGGERVNDVAHGAEADDEDRGTRRHGDPGARRRPITHESHRGARTATWRGGSCRPLGATQK